MATEVIMPKVDMAMETGIIHAWKVKPGDKVKSGDLLFEIETDKANMEIESPADGIVGELIVAQGVVTPVGAVVTHILASGEKAPDAPKPAVAAAAAAIAASPPGEAPKAFTAPPVSESGKLRATPLARKLARDGGIALQTLAGSGPHGRIVAADVKARAVAPAPAAPVASTQSDAQVRAMFTPGRYREIPHDNMRRTIARRLVEAKQTVPHFYLSADCEIDRLLALREEINAAAPKGPDGAALFKLSVNDMIIKALAVALQRVPEANVTWTESALLRHQQSDVGVAVSVPGGLITPVIREACRKPLSAIALEMRDLAKRARERKLKPEEYQGGSTAVSNLGMYGVKEFAAIINPPQATILAVGAGEERPVARKGQLALATVMTATLSCDHRAVDGALGAELLAQFRLLIEKPAGMLA